MPREYERSRDAPVPERPPLPAPHAVISRELALAPVVGSASELPERECRVIGTITTVHGCSAFSCASSGSKWRTGDASVSNVLHARADASWEPGGTVHVSSRPHVLLYADERVAGVPVSEGLEEKEEVDDIIELGTVISLEVCMGRQCK